MESKTSLRKQAKLLRDSLDTVYITDISNKIVNNITLWDRYKESKNVMLFYPIKSEISLLGLLSDKTKSFYFPSVVGNDIFPVQYFEKKGFKNGDFNIKEPVGLRIDDFSVIDLIFAPALAVDKNGYRLGYGKGYYDRFFEHISLNVVKAVPVFSKLFLENIPYETYDKTVDYVITEDSICPTLHSILNG